MSQSRSRSRLEENFATSAQTFGEYLPIWGKWSTASSTGTRRISWSTSVGVNCISNRKPPCGSNSPTSLQGLLDESLQPGEITQAKKFYGNELQDRLFEATPIFQN